MPVIFQRANILARPPAEVDSLELATYQNPEIVLCTPQSLTRTEWSCFPKRQVAAGTRMHTLFLIGTRRVQHLFGWRARASSTESIEN